MSTSNALSQQPGGTHYKNMVIQPVEFISANCLEFLEGCIIKRACRHESKGGIEDIKKIIHEAKLIAKLHYGVDL